MEFFNVISLTIPILISGFVLIFAIKKKFLSTLDIPLDNNLTLNKVRLFGNNKTYRGLVIFVTISIIVSYLLRFFYQRGYHDLIHPIFNASPFLIGLIYSLSYTLGELINSAIKRQLHIKPGELTKSKLNSAQYFLDLSDGIIATGITLIIFTQVTIIQATIAIVLGIGIHFYTDKLMQSLGLKQRSQ